MSNEFLVRTIMGVLCITGGIFIIKTRKIRAKFHNKFWLPLISLEGWDSWQMVTGIFFILLGIVEVVSLFF